jgi:hypothetical protein
MNYVYLMRSGNRYKIGRAKNVGQRLRTFRTADPTIQVEHVIPCRQASQLEAELHHRFDHQHIDLEWFRLSPGDVAFIKSLGGNSGRWLQRQQGRRRFWRQARRFARRVIVVIFWLVIIYCCVRLALWALPQLRNVVIRIR